MRKLLSSLKSDESLMLGYQRGDTVAFEVLYRRYKDELFNFIYRSSQDPTIVEDIAHETWTSIIRNVANYKPSASFRTMLYQIARHRIVDHWRKNKNELEEYDEQADQGYIDSRHQQSGIDQMELVNNLTEALGLLPSEQREAFLLQEQGFSRKEIADITACKEETVKSRIRYARKQLKSILEPVT